MPPLEWFKGRGGVEPREARMADLSVTIAGIRSPNPFWLASAPPTNTGDQCARAFDHGWGGVVWKTIAHSHDEIVNLSSRFGAVRTAGGALAGINNLELISDRSMSDNLAELAALKRRYPHNTVVASIATGPREQWRELVQCAEQAGADGLELNFSCPHGMCERGQGSAVGQDLSAIATITGWVKEVATRPVFVKLTPNITDICDPARAAVAAGVDGLSLINTLKSIAGVDLQRLAPSPIVDGRSSNGGLAGATIKPVALFMLASLARDPAVTVPLSGIGGVSDWRDCAEFMLLGASTVQVCTAAMIGGYRIVRDMHEGLSDWMDEMGFATTAEVIGRAVPNFVPWGELNPDYRVVSHIAPDKCIGCQRCYPACRDGGHDAIRLPSPKSGGKPCSVRQDGVAHRIPEVDERRCVGCNLCSFVCPVPGCITMRETG